MKLVFFVQMEFFVVLLVQLESRMLRTFSICKSSDNKF